MGKEVTVLLTQYQVLLLHMLEVEGEVQQQELLEERVLVEEVLEVITVEQV